MTHIFKHKEKGYIRFVDLDKRNPRKAMKLLHQRLKAAKEVKGAIYPLFGRAQDYEFIGMM